MPGAPSYGGHRLAKNKRASRVRCTRRAGCSSDSTWTSRNQHSTPSPATRRLDLHTSTNRLPQGVVQEKLKGSLSLSSLNEKRGAPHGVKPRTCVLSRRFREWPKKLHSRSSQGRNRLLRQGQVGNPRSTSPTGCVCGACSICVSQARGDGALGGEFGVPICFCPQVHKQARKTFAFAASECLMCRAIPQVL